MTQQQLVLPLRQTAGRITEAADNAGMDIRLDGRPVARVRLATGGYEVLNLAAHHKTTVPNQYEALAGARRIARMLAA